MIAHAAGCHYVIVARAQLLLEESSRIIFLPPFAHFCTVYHTGSYVDSQNRSLSTALAPTIKATWHHRNNGKSINIILY